MEEEMHDLLKKFQKQGIDPAALEESLRSAFRGKWTREKGLAAFKKAKFDIEFDVDFTGFGTLK